MMRNSMFISDHFLDHQGNMIEAIIANVRMKGQLQLIHICIGIHKLLMIYKFLIDTMFRLDYRNTDYL